MSSLIPGIVIQLAYTFSIHNAIMPIDFKAVTDILSSNDKMFKMGAAVFIRDVNYVLVFFSCQIALSWLLGRMAKSIVRSMACDIRWKLFRFRNKWHYILKGEIIKFPENKLEKGIDSVDSTIIDALVVVNNQSYIYTGLLSDYHLTDVGSGLEHLELLKVYRKELSGQTDDSVVPTDTFILPYCNVVNLNLHYIEDIDRRAERERNRQKSYKQLIANAFIFWMICFIPVFIPFRFISISWYEYYLQAGILPKILIYLSITQFLSFFLPVEKNGTYDYGGWKIYTVKTIVFALTVGWIIYAFMH